MPLVSTPQRVLDAVALVYSVSVEALLARGRSKRVAEARNVAFFVLRKYLGLSWPEAGRVVGGRDHSTGITAVRRIEWRLRNGGPAGDVALRIQSVLELISAANARCGGFCVGVVGDRLVDYREGMRRPDDVCAAIGCGRSRAEHAAPMPQEAA